MHQHKENALPLGKKTSYDQTYNPKLLYPISRAGKRREIGIDPEQLPFFGFDYWNHYEVSWLNEKGKPVVAMAEIVYDCHSPRIVESKSLKLYFNSLNNTKFNSKCDVLQTIKKDLEQAIGASVQIAIVLLAEHQPMLKNKLDGECMDHLDIACDTYQVDPGFLTVHDHDVAETLYSDLLKSNCLVTNQPDWGSVQIHYIGKKIDRIGLLRYIISFRNHNEFHEQCIERMFQDILTRCSPKQLTIWGRYTRRGGLDINPYRSTEKQHPVNLNPRLIRQ